MCGRYSVKAAPNEIAKTFTWLKFSLQPSPRYNVAPTQSVIIVKNDGQNEVTQARWGLVPSWAKSLETQKIQPINAKAETIAESRMFAPLLKHKRCILLADGFFEWKHDGKIKTPYYFRLKSGQPFAFAGLWDTWRELESCLLITGEPNELVAPIHNRMPMMLDSATAQEWISEEEHPLEARLALLQPYPASLMESYPVTPDVNKVANDTTNLIER